MPAASEHFPATPGDGSATPVALPSTTIFSDLATRAELAQLLSVPHRTLTFLLYERGVGDYYRTWTIKKRSGGSRDIMAPRSTLYRVQKSLNSILQDVYVPKPAAHGFVRTRNVLSNAQHHVHRRFVLNVDLFEFFPSITFWRVWGLFRASPFNCTDQVAKTLARICCYGGSLPIGAPTSPVISNMICFRLDAQLQRLARGTGAWYSRYADDLTFSTDRSPFPTALAHVDQEGVAEVGEGLRSIIESNGFSPNALKTRLQSRGNRQVVTGILVNEHVNVDRRYVRRIRAMLHAWDRYGLDAAQRRFTQVYSKDRHPAAAARFDDVLRGRIAYIEMVRGTADPVAARFKMQFNNLRSGREINDGVAQELSTIAAAARPPSAADRQGRDLTDLPSDIYERWKGRTDPVAARVVKAVKLYLEAKEVDDYRTAVVEIAGALEFIRPQVHKYLKRDEAALFNIFNNFGLRHLKTKGQLTEYGVEFLVWVFRACLSTADLIDQLMSRDSGPAGADQA